MKIAALSFSALPCLPLNIATPATAADEGTAAIERNRRRSTASPWPASSRPWSAAPAMHRHHRPKTREIGEIFENATNAAFLEQGKGKTACPDAATLASNPLAAAEKRLQAAFPAPNDPPRRALPRPARPGRRPGNAQPGVAARREDRHRSPLPAAGPERPRRQPARIFAAASSLIAFGYTYCPDICPTTLVEMAAILKQLGDQAARMQAIFISVDPERDTGKVLKTYTEFFDPRILGLTGSPALVRRAADNFKIRYAKVREPGSDYDLVYETYGTLNADAQRTPCWSATRCRAPPRRRHYADNPRQRRLVGQPRRPRQAARYRQVLRRRREQPRRLLRLDRPEPDQPGHRQAWGADFPMVTVEDWVDAQARLADHLGIDAGRR
jgi:hypothetical protein